MSTHSTSSPLVQTEWLAEHLDDPNLRVVDARWKPRVENGQGISADDYEGYLDGHVPGAVFVGMLNDLSDRNNPTSDMLAPPEQFAAVMSRLGIGYDTLVVAYDNIGPPAVAARLWWALSYYGHQRVQVLDGGLRKWRAEGRAISTDIPTPEPATFTARPQKGWLASKEEVLASLGKPGVTIVDCLFPELYNSSDGHLWGRRPGHIPGAVNVPYFANIDPGLADAAAEDRDKVLASDHPLTFGSAQSLTELYGNAGVTPDQEVITYCGLGYAAACGMLALKLLGHERVRVYDGSWTEWSSDPNLPLEKIPQS